MKFPAQVVWFAVMAAAGCAWSQQAEPGKKPPPPKPPDPDNLELVRKIRDVIVKKSTETEAVQMKPYTGTVPETAGISYQMAAIPAGEFLLGSPAGEKYRHADEGPQVKVKLEPFWMGAHEVTLAQCLTFVTTQDRHYVDTRYGKSGGKKEKESIADAITGPTEPELWIGPRDPQLPASDLTLHAALKYCQWLSALTGHFYRLPTEAEWEYAARAGTTTAYFFGEDSTPLGDYAWHSGNSESQCHAVGQKKPNPWGLYDIYGNAAEWTLDAYAADWYATLATSGSVTAPFHKPARRFPIVMRGGCCDDDPKDCRSARRKSSRRPGLTNSFWHNADFPFCGFRLVRPLKIPSAEEMQEIWNFGIAGENK